MCTTVWRHLVIATEVTASLAESNGSLPLGGWLKVTCDQLRVQRSVTSMGERYFFIDCHTPATY